MLPPDGVTPWMTSLGVEFREVGRTGKMLKVKVPAELHPEGSGVPGQVVTGSPESWTVTVIGLAVELTRLFAKRRMRAPVEEGFVTVPVGIGNRTLTWPVAELSDVTPLCASVSVMVEAEEILGALR